MRWSLGRVLGRRAGDAETGRIVFAAREADLNRVDVRLGPCFAPPGPRGGRGRPLASLYDQWPDGPDTLDALYRTIGGRGAEPWVVVRHEPPGTLRRLNPDFTAALAALRAAEQEVTSGVATPGLPYEDVAQRWLAVTTWPPAQKVGGLVTRLIGDVAEAVEAVDVGGALYCWTGPVVPPKVVAHGRTMEQYDDLRRRRRCP